MSKNRNSRWVDFLRAGILCACVQGLSCLGFPRLAWADQDEIRVPVEVSVDPYFQLLLESESVRIGPDGHDAEKQNISAGSLSFGTEIGRMEGKMASPVPEVDGGLFSTTHKTVTHVTVLNNQEPFELRISVLPEGTFHSLVEMKSTDQKGSLRIKVDAEEKTKHPEYLVQKGSWVDFGLDGNLMVYNSHETVSDSFTVSFAIIDLDPKTKASQYGGRVLWTLSSTL